MIRKILALGAAMAALSMTPVMARGIIIDGTIDICGVQEFYGTLDPVTESTEVNIGAFNADEGLGEFGTVCEALTHPATTFNPFSINFFGTMYDSFHFNENGILTFGAPLDQPIGTSLFDLDVPAIAPFFADGFLPFISQPQFGWASDFVEDQLWLTWSAFDEEGGDGDRNRFQLSIVDQGGGDFDLIFNYDTIAWDTLAQAGFTDGNGGGFVFDGALTDGAYLGDDNPFTDDLVCGPLSLACNMLNDGTGLGAFDFDNDELRTGYYKIEFRDGVPINVDLIPSEVPLPAAFWLFGAGIAGLVSTGRKKRLPI